MRSMAFCRVGISATKDKRKWPGLPKGAPGMRATTVWFKINSTSCMSELIFGCACKYFCTLGKIKKVPSAGKHSTYGNYVVINHNNGFETLYAHLSRIDVEVGQVLEQGSALGQMGSTGRSTGTHLHFEVHKNGKEVNPLSYLNWFLAVQNRIGLLFL